jgi:hypothetical protein
VLRRGGERESGEYTGKKIKIKIENGINRRQLESTEIEPFPYPSNPNPPRMLAPSATYEGRERGERGGQRQTQSEK